VLDDAVKWECPWCGCVATQVLESICESRLCDCGALALGAPSVDYDEITDEAIGYFRIQIQQESRGFESRLLSDILQSGVEFRDGATDTRGKGFWDAYVYRWFRRTASEGT
jgi:hypothetical protein